MAVQIGVRPGSAGAVDLLLECHARIRHFISVARRLAAARGLPEAEVRAANRLATTGLVPDLTLLLALAPGEGLARAGARGSADRIERAEAAFHERVAAAFLRFSASEWQQEHPECGPIVAVDAAGTEDEVESRLRAVVAARVPGLLAAAVRA